LDFPNVQEVLVHYKICQTSYPPTMLSIQWTSYCGQLYNHLPTLIFPSMQRGWCSCLWHHPGWGLYPSEND